jgi:chemotaxis-related protein WspD
MTAMPGTEGCWREVGRPGPGTCPELREHIVCRACPRYCEAALRLLDRPSPSDYVRQWTRHLAAAADHETRATVPVIVFRVGSEALALPARLVEGVADPSAVHVLPHRRMPVQGIVSIRGDLVACVSLAALLEIDDEETAGATAATRRCRRLLLLNGGDGRVAVEVRDVFELHRYDPAALTAPPSTIARSTGERFTTGLFPWQQATAACLDGDRVLSAVSRSLS